MTLSIPGHLYADVMRLVNESGYSVEDAIAKAAANAARTREERPVAPSPTPTEANTDTLTIRVDWTPPAGYGANTRGKLKDQFRPKKTAHATGHDAAAGVTGWTCPDMPVLVAHIHWEDRKRRKDSDNALATCKHLIDGICKGLGINDRRFITSMAFQHVDPQGVGYTDITIRPATESERRLTA